MALRRRGGLPEDLVVWEILVRLPPKPLLRCRLVCRSWRRLTSTHEFLLAHHRRQPSLPLIAGYKDVQQNIVEILTFDRRDAARPPLHPVAQLKRATFDLLASCDGVLILRNLKISSPCSICNPTTRQYADLPLISGSKLMGLYHHRLTGEYRILLHRREKEDLIPGYRYACYVYTLGSSDMPRRIGWLEASAIGTSVLLHDSLHWFSRTRDMILVFDTTAESSRWICSPADTMNETMRIEGLFEMDGALGMYRCDFNKKVVEIYVLQDYKREVWSLKYRVELPVQEIRARGNLHKTDRWYWSVLVSSKDGDALVLVKVKQYLFYIDTDGKLLAASQYDGDIFLITPVKLKQSLVPHAFFPLLEGYAVNAPHFI